MPTDIDHAPYLLLSIRDEDAAADDEYQAMMRFAGLDENGMHRIRLTHRSLGPIDLTEWSGIILGGGPYNVSDPQESKTETQRRVESELLSLVDRIVDRDFPFLGCCYGVGMLGIGRRCHRRPQLPRTGRCRHGHADSGRTRGAAVRRSARRVRCIRRTQGGGQFAALPCGLPRIVARLPRSGLPGRRQHVCDAVPSRTGPRGHLHQDRRLQEPRLLRTRVG